MFTPFDGFTFFPAVMSFALTAYNLARWPTDAAVSEGHGRVSVLIPARNEAANIEVAVRAALAALRPGDEVIVGDDASTDDTPAILARLAAEDRRLTWFQGEPLPAGLVGKPHLCRQLGARATGDVLVFVDADVRLLVDGPARLAALLASYDAALVTGYPRHEHGTFAERVVMPFLPVSFLSWIPVDAVWRSRKPWLVMANGQVMAFTRAGYDRIGGFAVVQDQVIDDVALARHAKTVGERVVFAGLDRTAACRMYTSSSAMWEGFTKNMYEGLGRRTDVWIAAMTLYLSAFVLPYVRFAVGWAWWGAPAWEASAALAATLAMRALLDLRFRHAWWSWLLHPFGALVVVAMAWASRSRVTGEGVTWRGRTYVRSPR